MSHLSLPTQESRARIRAAGLRATPQRTRVLARLALDRRHPTVEMLHASLEADGLSLPLSTVYAAVESFLEAGLIRRVGRPGGALRVDGIATPHDHAICRECGRIYDLEAGLFSRPDLPDHLPGGLRVSGMHLELEVLCPECPGDSRADP